MASRAVVPEQARVGGGKQKNGHAEGRNRRVLGDIGNLVIAPAVEGKPQNQIARPITRSFGAQLLANAQAAKEKNNSKKPLAENVNDLVGKDGAVKAAVPHKKEPLKLKNEAVIVISPDEDESCKSGRKLREGSSKKPNKTLTSVLTARSKKPKDLVDIDAADVDNELSAVEYVEDIYNFYKLTEVSDFIAISDNAYVREQVLLMEKAILGKLEWYLTVPTPYVFIVRYIKASLPSDKEMENMTFFFAELGLMNYSAIIPYCPSMLAASAVYAARCTLNRIPLWTLKHHTGYSEDQLMECARLLVSFHAGAGENKLKAVSRKYSNPERSGVALFPAARSLLPICC
ncbi:UNVERIFIED_CONTAM: G2/mitotic-specific cyclin S13-6 [Sesamum latifolium]|uniref:G2/mitotic-specific cyclin S13-6 n=1 Tax=Sesamum latifolium TaxID=2727402 RepID=A0AAW2XY62_9LAMI